MHFLIELGSIKEFFLVDCLVLFVAGSFLLLSIYFGNVPLIFRKSGYDKELFLMGIYILFMAPLISNIFFFKTIRLVKKFKQLYRESIAQNLDYVRQRFSISGTDDEIKSMLVSESIPEYAKENENMSLIGILLATILIGVLGMLGSFLSYFTIAN